MKKWYVITVVLALALVISLSMWSSSTAEVDRLKQGLDIRTSNLEKDVAYWKERAGFLDDKLNAPQALIEITEMHFEWDENGKGKIVGQVKNIGSADAKEVFVRVMEYRGQYGERFGAFLWVDYLRAGENKPFKLGVSKPYCDDKYIPQIEIGFKTVGEYGREWKSAIMHR